MRKALTAFSAIVLALSAMGGAARAAVPGFDSAYAGESAFLTLAPGQQGSFTVFFANTGTTAWTRGTSTQLDLAACRDNKTTCDAQDASEAPFNSGWLTATRYATTTQSAVAPGSIGTFTYNVAVPAGQAAGTYRFNGALVLSTTGADIHNEGYYQDLTVTTVANPAPVLTNITPTSGSVAGGTVLTITGLGFICSPSFPTVSFGGTLGTTTACGPTSLTVTTPAHAAGTVSVTVSNTGSGPSNAASFTFVDVGAPQFTSVSAIGSTITLNFNESVCRTNALLVGDVVYSVNGGVQTNPQNLGGAITTSGLQTCSPNPPTSTSPSTTGATTFSVFAQSPFVQNDRVTVTLFNASSRLVDLSGNVAPSATQDDQARRDNTSPSMATATATGSNVIRLIYDEPVFCNNAQPSQFTATPAGGSTISAVGLNCDVGPSSGSGGSTAVSVTFLTAVSPDGVGGSVTYVQSATAANRVKDIAGNEAVSPQTVSYPPFTPQAPTMLDTRLTTTAGFSSQLDAGDAFRIAFSQKMNTAAPGNIILRVRDGDGTTSDISCTSTAVCQWNGADTTMGGITYGFNEVLTVTLTTTPTALTGFSGTTPGLAIPSTIIDASGLTNPDALGVDFANSPDRVIDVE